MLITQSINGVPIRLTDERWRHIRGRHPEMDGERDKLIETISMPDFVQKGDRGEKIALKFHMETPLSSKYPAVIYREVSDIDGFVVTAYFTNKPASRGVIWRR